MMKVIVSVDSFFDYGGKSGVISILFLAVSSMFLGCPYLLRVSIIEISYLYVGCSVV